MNLDELTIEIRPRRPWEAVDLGIRMAQRWWWSLIKIWFVVTLPLWAVMYFLPAHLVILQLLVFWFLLPFFERLLLHFLSNAVFNQMLSTRDAIKAFPRLALKQFFVSLLWRRFSFTRSMDMPVSMLEGLSGSRRSSRIAVLHREDASPAGWLTVMFFCNMIFMSAAIFSLVYFFVGDEDSFNWWSLFNQHVLEYADHKAWLILNTLVYVSWSIVTPFYVSGGFALYLNRRIRLEAWDVEIAFRRIVQKQALIEKRDDNQSGGAGTIAVSFLLVCTLMFAGAYSGDAAANALVEDDISKTKHDIESILQGEDFNQKKIIENTRYPWETEDEEPEQDDERYESDNAFLELLGRFFKGVSDIGEVLLWALVIGLVLLVLYRYRHWFSELEFENSQSNSRKPDTLFGLKVSAESLPDDVSAQALILWQQKKFRESMALLYRACLVQLVERGLELDDGDTERECLLATQKNASRLGVQGDMLGYFDRVTRHWRRLAYGHLLPNEDDAIALCQDWTRIWRAGPVE